MSRNAPSAAAVAAERAAKVGALLSVLALTTSSVAQAEFIQASLGGSFRFRANFFLFYATAVCTLPAVPAAAFAQYAWRRYAIGEQSSATMASHWRDFLLPRLEANEAFSLSRYAAAAAPLNALTFASFYLFVLALEDTPVSVGTSVFRAATVCLVFALSVVLLREPPTPVRVAATALCVAGVAMAGYGNYRWPSDGDAERSGHAGAARGYALMGSGALLWASHDVLFQRAVGRPNGYGVALLTFFGQAFAALAYWPVWLAVSLSGAEPWPDFGDSRTGVLVLVNSAFSAVPWHSIALSLAGPLFTDLAGTMAVPMSGVADVVLHGASYAPLTVCGMVTVTCGIAVVSLAGHVGGGDGVVDGGAGVGKDGVGAVGAGGGHYQELADKHEPAGRLHQ